MENTVEDEEEYVSMYTLPKELVDKYVEYFDAIVSDKSPHVPDQLKCKAIAQIMALTKIPTRRKKVNKAKSDLKNSRNSEQGQLELEDVIPDL